MVTFVDGWVSTRDKLDTKRLTNQNGIGWAEKWASVGPCRAHPRRQRRRQRRRVLDPRVVFARRVTTPSLLRACQITLATSSNAF